MFPNKGGDKLPKENRPYIVGDIDLQVFLEVTSHEALIRQAYKDSKGIWTWSNGITSASGHNVERYIDNPQPIERCIEVSMWLLRTKYAPAVKQAFGEKFKSLTKAQFTAALSFHWNTGGILRASWVKSFCRGNETQAYAQFMNWSKPKEIIPRRRKERELFFEGKWTNDGTVLEFTRLRPNYQPDWSSGQRIDVSNLV